MQEADRGPKPAVLAISGSARAGSNTRKALGVAVSAAERTGAEILWVDLAELKLPPFDEGANGPENVERFKGLVQRADALLVATPVYHDSYSGVLKNAFDHLHSELNDKLAALIAVGGGRFGQGQALEHLRSVLREANAWVLPRQVQIPLANDAFDDQGKLKDAEYDTRLTVLGQEVVLRAHLFRRRSR